MSSTTTTNTIEKLRISFSQLGLPKVIVSDNGPQFVSEEFHLFLTRNGIKHITSAPYHPRTNGQAEQRVQVFKQAMKSATCKESCGSIQQKLSTFLFRYRTTPHSPTNETPAKLLYGRNLRTRLDLIKPSLHNAVSSGQEKMKLSIQSSVREFTEGQRVTTKDYRSAERRWIPAEIQSRTGPLSYTVDTGLGITWRRHADQLCSGISDINVEPVINISEVVVPTAS
eukprot:XP_011427330.1 PREDICTED: uncharacterized protein K02A2.6-like [Crassostrea gigas]